MSYTDSDIRKAQLEGVQMGIELTIQDMQELLVVNGSIDDYEKNKIVIERIHNYIKNKQNNESQG